MQMNIRKITYSNFGERYEGMINHVFISFSAAVQLLILRVFICITALSKKNV